MKIYLPVIIFFQSIFLLSSCNYKKEKSSIAFYHWKADMNISKSELHYLDSLNAKKLYVRFFDVIFDKDKKAAVPVSQLEWKCLDFKGKMEIVPVVFITNNCMIKMRNRQEISKLAANMSKKLESMLSEIDSAKFQVREIQLDCDWSMETQSNYFSLIEEIRKNMPRISKFSATIRLHQVKYFAKTGVPPVDEGVLMFYNMGDITNENENNSILNLKKAKSYLENFDIYPLKLDVALPLFSWAVQFRDKKVLQLINDLSTLDLDNNTNFKKISENRYLVLESCYVKGIYVYKNDQLRIETIKQKELEQSVKMLKKAFGRKHFNLVFYHLDDYVMNRFTPEKIKYICN